MSKYRVEIICTYEVEAKDSYEAEDTAVDIFREECEKDIVTPEVYTNWVQD